MKTKSTIGLSLLTLTFGLMLLGAMLPPLIVGLKTNNTLLVMLATIISAAIAIPLMVIVGGKIIDKFDI